MPLGARKKYYKPITNLKDKTRYKLVRDEFDELAPGDKAIIAGMAEQIAGKITGLGESGSLELIYLLGYFVNNYDVWFYGAAGKEAKVE